MTPHSGELNALNTSRDFSVCHALASVQGLGGEPGESPAAPGPVLTVSRLRGPEAPPGLPWQVPNRAVAVGGGEGLVGAPCGPLPRAWGLAGRRGGPDRPPRPRPRRDDPLPPRCPPARRPGGRADLFPDGLRPLPRAGGGPGRLSRAAGVHFLGGAVRRCDRTRGSGSAMDPRGERAGAGQAESCKCPSQGLAQGRVGEARPAGAGPGPWGAAVRTAALPGREPGNRGCGNAPVGLSAPRRGGRAAGAGPPGGAQQAPGLPAWPCWRAGAGPGRAGRGSSAVTRPLPRIGSRTPAVTLPELDDFLGAAPAAGIERDVPRQGGPCLQGRAASTSCFCTVGVRCAGTAQAPAGSRCFAGCVVNHLRF